MNLEPCIHSEVSQKEKNKYYILKHIYIEYRKILLMNLFAGHEWRHRLVNTGQEGEVRTS